MQLSCCRIQSSTRICCTKTQPDPSQDSRGEWTLTLAAICGIATALREEPKTLPDHLIAKPSFLVESNQTMNSL